MIWSVLADVALVGHAGFLLFVVLGGLLSLRWRRAWWVHVPCVVWGVWIEFSGWVCPVTDLENEWRRRGGEAGYPGGFIEHYVTAALYPDGLTRGTQVVLGLATLALNLLVYWAVWRRRRAPAADPSTGEGPHHPA